MLDQFMTQATDQMKQSFMAVLNMMDNDEVRNKLAAMHYKQKEAYVSVGFTDKEALALVVAAISSKQS